MAAALDALVQMCGSSPSCAVAVVVVGVRLVGVVIVVTVVVGKLDESDKLARVHRAAREAGGLYGIVEPLFKACTVDDEHIGCRERGKVCGAGVEAVRALVGLDERRHVGQVTRDALRKLGRVGRRGDDRERGLGGRGGRGGAFRGVGGRASGQAEGERRGGEKCRKGAEEATGHTRSL